jgi:dihydrodipicolinate synthase/N-acetylneuraminate lyase
MTTSSKIAGVYAPTVTAFRADQSIDEYGTRAFTRFLLDSGVHGLVPMGSAGDGMDS